MYFEMVGNTTEQNLYSCHMLIIQLLRRPVVSNHPYPQLCFMYLLLVLLLLRFLLSVCVPAGVSDGSPPGFYTEAVGCFLFGFYRYSS